MPGFALPEAPASLAGRAVKAWSQAVVIPTFEPMPADRNPMFLEKRVYQGSSGKVYPLPFVDRISTEKKDRAWQALHIENEFVRLMILPEIGGRIHVGLDKTNGYDFFYRQNVIKPALVGLAGPWISGGVEFNWPQHHRPSTFMPMDWSIEEHSDGSVTAWCSEHEPMARMKGMHGVCLRPGSSLIELKVRMHNRTELPQTFLWWANVAARVHEQYQSFFPPDVQYVADHAKRAMSRFPLCAGKYYGVDYGNSALSTRHSEFRFPPGDYPRNDLTWYANIPVPTSYMILGTKEDFFGGYDHYAQAGFVHVADHRIAPGKKQWTWGNHPFGYAWDRNLTEPDDPSDSAPPYRRNLPAPYIELMAGVFTDNQPDFSWLMPGETRSFSQYWYPIQKIGPVQKASCDAALSLTPVHHEGAKGEKTHEENLEKVRIGVAVTERRAGMRVELRRGCEVVFSREGVTLGPGQAMVEEVALPAGTAFTGLRLALVAENGGEILAYQPVVSEPREVPAPAQEPALPAEVKTAEELYLIGLHLEQYRHATRMPEDYWREALRRDPGDARCNNALGLWHYRRGEFEKAVACFEKAIATLTKYNPNPRDGEVFYTLGLTLRQLGRIDEAYEAFGKAMWDEAWQAAARREMNAIDLLRKGGGDDAPGDGSAPRDAQGRLDAALDRARAGQFSQAVRALEGGGDVQHPMIHYARAFFLEKLGRSEEAAAERAAAAGASTDYCFPHRLEEIAILQDAIDKNPEDARAPYYLGCLYYDKRRHEEAIALWEKAARLNRAFPTVWRNLGIAYFNILHDKDAARGAYQKAFKNSLTRVIPQAASSDLPSDVAQELAELTQEPAFTGGDARVLYERDQLWKRTQEPPERRLEELEQYLHLVQQRDDLTLEYCALLNLTRRHAEALEILQSREFQPWEGGEGMALAQWARTHLALGRRKLFLSAAEGGSPAEALRHFAAALHPPENLGEAWHFLQNNSELHYWAGLAARACGERETARAHFETAAASVGDFQRMSVCAYSEMSVWAGLALRELEKHLEARALFEGMLDHAETLRRSEAKIDYFATSLPTMLLFDEDIQAAQARQATLIEALARYGLNDRNDRKTARRLLGDVLQQDPGHAVAADLLESLDWSL